MEMEEFYKFLSRKSVLGIINSLAKDKPLQFKDIKSGFDISDKTVFKITSELLELNLVKKSIVIREGKHVDVYELTELGKEVHSLLDQINYTFKKKEKEEKGKEEEEEEEKQKKKEGDWVTKKGEEEEKKYKKEEPIKKKGI
jgi:DNA-binding HxlR family transcriptional regulator